MRLSFAIPDALPPRKTTSPSMWSRNSESLRLIKLRQTALSALGNRAPFQTEVRLWLTIYVGEQYTRRKGDLDAYLGGVFDGLQGATTTTRLADVWSDPTLAAIHPGVPLVIMDDYLIASVRAEKRAGGTMRGYHVLIEDLASVRQAWRGWTGPANLRVMTRARSRRGRL